MRNIAKETATYITVMGAAIIGAVLFLTLTAAVLHQNASQPTTTPGRIVTCNLYINHTAMVAASETNITPTQAAGFCAAPAN